MDIVMKIAIAASKAGWDNNDLFYLPYKKLLEGLESLKKENS